jgi:hypothetical protein
MKKIFLSLITVFTISLLHAQFKVGIKASAIENNARVNANHGNYFAGDKTKGYQAGLIADWKLSNHLYLQPQVLYTRTGVQLLNAEAGKDLDVKMDYVELPVNLVYKVNLPFGKVFAGTGATFSYGVGGKEQQGNIKTRLYAGNNPTWRREDISLNFTAGVEFNNGVFASFNSQKGFLDMHKGSNMTMRHKSLSVSVGYLVDWSKFKRKA